jgi:hypothetical protein
VISNQRPSDGTSGSYADGQQPATAP